MKLNKNLSMLVVATLALTGCGQIQNNISTNNSEVTTLDLTQIQNTKFASSETNLQLKELIPGGFSLKAAKPKAGDVIPGRYIVKFKKNADENGILKRVKAKKLGDIRKSDSIGLIEQDASTNGTLEALKKDANVEYIEQDRIITVDITYINLVIKISMYGGTYTYNYTLMAGSTFNMVINGATYSYVVSAQSCLTGPNPPAGVTFSLPLCGTAPSPAPTATPTIAPTPVATATPVLPSPTPSAVITPVPTATSSSIPTPVPTNLTINDPYFGQQYAHNVSKSLDGWKISQGSSNVTIAIIDTGIDGNHPDLAGKMVPGYSLISGALPNQDGNGHGTHCAGIAAASMNNAIGVVGFAPNAKLMPIRALDASGSGTLSAIAAGITYAANSNVDVISLSLGGPSDSTTFRDAINYALSKNKVVVAATGNNSTNQLSYPAAYSGVIAVAATDANNARASFSQYGSHVSVAAPGVNILSTYPGGKYANMSGTSMATPAVAGLAALLKGYRPNLTAADIKQKIEANADDLGTPGFDQYYGYGRINVFKTLSNS